MTKYSELMKKHSEELNKKTEKLGLFFAFSNNQFDKAIKENTLEGQTLVSIGGGGYLPKVNAEEFKKLMKNNWLKDEIKKFTQKEINEMIEYELSNYECYYTGEIADALDMLTEYGITREQVREVYHKNKSKHYND